MLIKFHVLLGKIFLECHKSLKEGLGTCAPEKKTVRWWVNNLKLMTIAAIDCLPCRQEK